jgi:hypothetical protein
MDRDAVLYFSQRAWIFIVEDFLPVKPQPCAVVIVGEKRHRSPHLPADKSQHKPNRSRIKCICVNEDTFCDDQEEAIKRHD